MTDKRQPTLADRFLANHDGMAEVYLQRPYVEALRRKVRAAHKFVFDENAAVRVAHVVRDVPELLIREHEFARAPFDLTWIEYPHHRFWRELMDGHPAALQDGTADHTIGYLIDGNTATTITGGTIDEPTMPPLPGVLTYTLNTEWPVDWQEEFIKSGGATMQGLDQYLWGSTWNSLNSETLDKLRSRYVVGLGQIRLDGGEEHTRKMLRHSFQGSIGEVRNIIAMLLMLNRPTITRHVGAEPTTRGWIRGKTGAFLSHTKVTIDIDAVPTMRLIGTPSGEGVPRRHHEVRGHFCHNHEAHDYQRIAGCQHEWVAADEWFVPLNGTRVSDANHWVCDACNGRRWWKRDHERGDKRRGHVVHDDYNVIAEGPKR